MYFVVEEGYFGCGIEDEQIVYFLFDEVVDEFFVGGDVQVIVGGQWGDDWGNDVVEFCGYGVVFCVVCGCCVVDGCYVVVMML